MSETELSAVKTGAALSDQEVKLLLVLSKPPGTAPTVEVKKTQWPNAVFQFPRLLPRQSCDAVRPRKTFPHSLTWGKRRP